MTRRTRLATLAASVVLVAACGDGADEDSDAATAGRDVTTVTVAQVESSPDENVFSALDDPTNPDFPDPLVDLSAIRSGGPPPDGIPPIDEPRFLDASNVDFLADDEPVLALTVGDETRAYPVQVLIWHEIVNDTLDGVPVTVSYCPLCNSAIAYDRRLGDRVLDFGTSGQLFNSALVMYDRQTESLWSHFTGEAVVGHLTGEQLETFPVATVSWSSFRDAHPDALVLSRDTGHDRSYGTNPYPGYDDVDTAPFLFDGEVDGRLAAKERVIGIDRPTGAVAVTASLLREERVVEVDDVVAWHLPGAASALDASDVADGRDVGASNVFAPEVDGEQLTFRGVDGGFEDLETGSTWDILGRAVDGPLEGSQLTAIDHVDTFWFAWAAFQPGTELVR